MIKKYFEKKKSLKSRNIILKKKKLINDITLSRYISTPLISQGNKSYD